MKSNLTSAAVFAALLAAAAVFSTASDAKSSSSSDQIAPSAATAKQLITAQKLMGAGDFKSALDQVRAAQAATGKTPDDDYLVNEFLAQISIKLNDIPTATTAFEAMADSPVLDKDPDKASTLYNVMIVENIAKHYQKTIAYALKLQAIQPLQDKQIAVLTEAYYDSGDYAHAKEIALKEVAAAKAAGRMPEHALVQMLLNSQFNTGDKAAAEATLEELAADYNLGADWERLIDIALSSKGQPTDALNLLRLGIVTSASLDASDYSLMGDIASRLGFFGDALAAARHGGKSSGAAKAAGDQKELPGLIAAAKNQDAKHNMVLAEDVYGYGRYAEAEELSRRALAKGGAADEANMLIGMSLAGQGKYADAVSVFGQVKGGTPQGAKGAHLWSLYAQHKAAPPAAAPAPSH